MAYDKEFVEKQKEILLEEKNRLEEKIKRLKTVQDYGSDEEDNAQEISDHENNLSIEEQLTYLLSKVKKALKAIDDGTYGLCAKCKENIEQGRLEIMPYAELCVTCKSQDK